MPLTNEQLIRLKPLTEHPIFGKLLSDAIKIWEKEKNFPAIAQFGIDFMDGETYKLYKRNSGKFKDNFACCLFGAALIGKKRLSEFNETILQYYGITKEIMRDLWDGFDDNETLSDESSEEYKFGLSINNALWPKTEEPSHM